MNIDACIQRQLSNQLVSQSASYHLATHTRTQPFVTKLHNDNSQVTRYTSVATPVTCLSRSSL